MQNVSVLLDDYGRLYFNAGTKSLGIPGGGGGGGPPAAIFIGIGGGGGGGGFGPEGN